MTSTSDGASAEQLALEFLCSKGMQLVARNFRRRFGELDLIMTDGPLLVFVEVRQRSNPRFGTGTATVSWQKQRKIIKTARAWLSTQSTVASRSCRFDVVSLQQPDDRSSITWIKDAFTLDG